MNKITCARCGEPKPEIAFELYRSGRPRSKCRTCRGAEKEESHRRCGDLRFKQPKCYNAPFIEVAW